MYDMQWRSMGHSFCSESALEFSYDALGIVEEITIALPFGGLIYYAKSLLFPHIAGLSVLSMLGSALPIQRAWVEWWL